MSDVVVLERVLSHPLERVFAFFSQEEHLLSWFGPKQMRAAEGSMDFESKGPWTCSMVSNEGNRYKVSGTVTSIDKPRSIGFTWGWHDDKDQRGHESFVLVEFEALGEAQTKLVLRHSNLPDDDVRASHAQGWTSSFESLEAALEAKLAA